MNNRQKLQQIISDSNMSRQQVADICHVSIYSVHNWLLPDKSTGHRNCPDMAIALLNCTLK